MKLTKKQAHELETVLYNVKRAYNYLSKDEIVGIAHKTTKALMTGGDYTINNPACVESARQSEHIKIMDKEIGSDIAGLSFALSQLEQFLKTNLD